MTTARDELPEANQTAPAVGIRLDRPVRPVSEARHAECAKVCQQAEAYGVWPEHSCSPACVWLTTDKRG